MTRSHMSHMKSTSSKLSMNTGFCDFSLLSFSNERSLLIGLRGVFGLSILLRSVLLVELGGKLILSLYPLASLCCLDIHSSSATSSLHQHKRHSQIVTSNR